MNRHFVASEYGTFLTHIENDWGIAPETLKAHEPAVKGLFRRYVGLSCVCAVVSDGVDRSEYGQAIPETAYLGMILSFRGCESTSAVLLRQMIELTMKHIFFRTHPVEYSWAQKRDGYREVGFSYLQEYLRKTDEIDALQGAEQVLATISDWYARLSRYTHLHNSRYMTFPGVHEGGGIGNIDMLKDASESLWPQLILILTIFCSGEFLNASPAEQGLIRDAMGTAPKKTLAAYLREASAR